jgi:mono/diheme cytochrome c family protein
MWREARPAAWALLALVVGCGRSGGDVEPPKAEAPRAALDGRTLYEVRCSPCHGMEGGGDGPAAAAIQPKPRNFRDPQFWQGRTAQQLRLVVKEGRPGTLMPPFEGVLSETEIDGVVTYLQGFKPSGS